MLLLVAAAIACLLRLVSPGLALGIGAAVSLTLGNPLAELTRRWTRPLLQGSVVLLGFGIDLPTLLRLGREGLAASALTIAATFLLGWLLARWLRVEATTSTLVSAGTAICGGSAIAAVGASINAPAAAMSVAMATVFLLNAAALYLFPPIGHALSLSPAEFGTWAGIAIHDVSSVVGAAAAHGESALQTATAVKLARSLWILPVAMGCALVFRRVASRRGAARGDAVAAPSATSVVPWFIGLFVLASAARSVFPTMIPLAEPLVAAGRSGLSLTLLLVGLSLSRPTLRAVGVRPLALGLLLWLAISVGSLSLIWLQR
jgi:uncharacterized integral membrane protein (TIGR00698 family)